MSITPAVGRLATNPRVSALVAVDTFDVLTERVRVLLGFQRRITLVSRWVDSEDTPTIHVGLCTTQPIEVRRTHGGLVATVYLGPGLGCTFGFSTVHHTETEAQAWETFHAAAGFRGGLTQVAMSGGLPGNGPALTDRVVIRRWNTDNRCFETVVAFDPGTGVNGVVAAARAKILDMTARWELPAQSALQQNLQDVADMLEGR